MANKTLISPKLVFSTLTLFGIIVLFLGFASLGRSITQPAAEREARLLETSGPPLPDYNPGSISASTEQLELQGKDTDEDGLSDYDELYVYSTSPYLPDSDSDGFSDSEEVASGNDPSCPAGENCRAPAELPVAESEVSNGLFEDLLPDDSLVAIPAPESLDLSSLSVAELRTLLLESGQVDENQLSQIDDETLIEAYQQILQEGLRGENP